MFAESQPISFIDGLAIVLSVVSLIVTIVGFFASLKFYRDGVNLQTSANNALTKIEEKTQFIQTQVGGMFDKTLDAAIGKKEAMSERFEELNEQVERTKASIIEEAVKQIGAAGEQERNRLEQIIDSRLELIKEKVESTRESAEDIAQDYINLPKSDFQVSIMSILSDEDDGLHIDEIARKLKMSRASTHRALARLSKHGLIRLDERSGRYYTI